MILQLAHYHCKKIACFFAVLFYASIVLPARAGSRHITRDTAYVPYKSLLNTNTAGYTKYPSGISLPATAGVFNRNNVPDSGNSAITPNLSPGKSFIGGPSQPEMSSFKSVSADKLVNLFTGDFSYNIPLLSVGDYPVNIYYDGSTNPDQEASWCGLGWNINPGNINRNTRGVPDDFNGKDTLTQVQVMKPNKTWGLGIGGDLELLGIKAPVEANIGVAFNNYLGPSLDLALRGHASYNVSKSAGSEKYAAGASLSVGIDINSRSGTSFSGGLSLLANSKGKENTTTFGIGLSTGYNSRSGIKALQISEQMAFNSNRRKAVLNDQGNVLYTYRTGGGINKSLYATSISFVKPSYIPSMRMPVTNTAWSGHFQLGLGSFGVAADVEAEVYGQKSLVAAEDITRRKPMVGYLYYQNAVNNPDYVMDFTRYNDREVTPNTPVISAPQYSYDVFTIQGEGTGGSVRAYRNDLGYVRDNITVSKDNNMSLGGDVDPPGHYGGNFNTIKTPSVIGEWNKGNKLRNSIAFTKADTTFENVYFRNPGENTVLDPDRFNQVGGTRLVRFVLGGSGQSPTIEPKLQSFDKTGKPDVSYIDLSQKPVIAARNKRTQVTGFLTAAEASAVGLDKVIKSYDNQHFLDTLTDTLIYESIPRVDGQIRKAHHISQINVTENNGKRYIYGIPVYNLIQKDFTFSVDNAYSEIPDKVGINDPNLHSQNSPYITDPGSAVDGYVQITTTPAYAHSFLLSGILSPDYVDVNGDGITEDDLGSAVKFNYSRIKSGNSIAYKWRAPLTQYDSANFNAGTWSEKKDDKGIISYGERESWYLQSIESKTMIALFYVSNRVDGKGTGGENGGINSSGNFLKKLDSIALFSKADLKKNGLAKAKPIKTVHLGYKLNGTGTEYQLCNGTPDNRMGGGGSKGKLTLQSVYFTYNGKSRAFKNKYKFSYAADSADNPSYAFAATDRWGTYKPRELNPGGMKNSDYPYSLQSAGDKTTIDKNAGVWMLKKITLPSGGQIEVNYESDDYAFVQNKRAAIMMQVAGFGSTNNYNTAGNRLYPMIYPTATENDYVFVSVPGSCSNDAEVYNKYLQGMTQLAFKIWVQMPKGPEYIPCYAGFGNIAGTDYGLAAGKSDIIWIKMKRVGGKSPVSLTVLEYLRQQLPGQAFKGYDVAGEPGLQQVGDMLEGMLKSLRDAFTDPVNAFRKDGKAMNTDLSKCFVRLNDPDGFKYGGGYRVKSVVLRDNWDTLTGQYSASYGQQYDYTTTENFNGSARVISSGVASYEPAIGGEENPWQSIVQVEDYLPLGPTSYGAVEMPVLDAFFPAPVVGYSKVTVTSIKKNVGPGKKSRSGVGRQVTEFYTAKDYPVYYSYTPFDAGSVKEFHQASTLAFFSKYAYDFKAQTQGFLVAVNDMHGKMKSQSSYAENDTSTRINYTENFYRNTGINGLSDEFTFISRENKGTAYSGNMGIDVELMTDTREFSVKSTSSEIQGQLDIFYLAMFTIPVPTVWTVTGTAENIYRAVTTTKCISYHSVLDSVVVIDKGSQVSTKNLAYDAYTGEVLVTRTNNEFDQPVYNTSYPAYWAYSGMGLAYKNTDAVYSNVNFSDGKITSGLTAQAINTVLESGDELYIIDPGSATTCPAPSSADIKLIWAFDKNKPASALTNTSPDFAFMDAKGNLYSRAGVTFKIIRSGHRNLLDAHTATVVSMANPLSTGKLFFDTTSKVLNAGSVAFKEKWQTDNDVIQRLKLVNDPVNCVIKEEPDSTGYLEKSINPYRKGLLGNFHSYKNFVFYDERKEADVTDSTNIVENGLLKAFKPYWDFNGADNLIPDTASVQWVWNSKVNKANAKGLELETVDALGIYTSAQYGYNKTMPVAITNNARYAEMFAESFEDYGYGESLSNARFNYGKKHIDLTKMTGSALVNADTTAFKAHSGKYMLKVNGSATASLSVPVSRFADDFSLQPAGKDTTKSLTNTGSNYTFTRISPKNVYDTGLFVTGSTQFAMGIDPTDTIFSSQRNHSYSFADTSYIHISTADTYTFNMSMSTAYETSGTPIVYGYDHDFFVNIYDSAGTLVSNYPLTLTNPFNVPNSSSATYNVWLCAGIYKIAIGGAERYLVSADGTASGYNENHYSWYCTTYPSPNYKDLTTANGCIYTRPIAATDSVLNPVFSVTTGKKMLFSAWVKEDCGNAANGIPCKEYTYTHNQVQLQFPNHTAGNVTLNPTGPVIDGWQRYEGTFTPPAGATTMTVKLVNSGTQPVYFDDIRVHPFNANMKSYVYDPVNLRLKAELDANNYATFGETLAGRRFYRWVSPPACGKLKCALFGLIVFLLLAAATASAQKQPQQDSLSAYREFVSLGKWYLNTPLQLKVHFVTQTTPAVRP